jgi:hypothetical protein
MEIKVGNKYLMEPCMNVAYLGQTEKVLQVVTVIDIKAEHGREEVTFQDAQGNNHVMDKIKFMDCLRCHLS